MLVLRFKLFVWFIELFAIRIGKHFYNNDLSVQTILNMSLIYSFNLNLKIKIPLNGSQK